MGAREHIELGVSITQMALDVLGDILSITGLYVSSLQYWLTISSSRHPRLPYLEDPNKMDSKGSFGILALPLHSHDRRYVDASIRPCQR